MVSTYKLTLKSEVKVLEEILKVKLNVVVTSKNRPQMMKRMMTSSSRRRLSMK